MGKSKMFAVPAIAAAVPRLQFRCTWLSCCEIKLTAR